MADPPPSKNRVRQGNKSKRFRVMYAAVKLSLSGRCVQENIVVIARHHGRIAALQKESSLEQDGRLDESKSNSLPTDELQVCCSLGVSGVTWMLR